jgi:hypothetical protein
MFCHIEPEQETNWLRFARSRPAAKGAMARQQAAGAHNLNSDCERLLSIHRPAAPACCEGSEPVSLLVSE